jgi:D-psicose/D-tagatose/L-ribulose 3-epimerase
VRTGAATFIWTSPFTSDDIHLVPRLKEIGFDLIEIAFEIPGAADSALLAREAAACGIDTAVLAFCTPERDVSAKDAAVREGGTRYLQEAVDFARLVGASIVGGPIAHPPGRARALPPAERHDERQRAIESLHSAAEYAGSNGVTLAVEQLCRYDSDMFNRATDTVTFVEEIDHPAVGILLDTFHMHIEEDSTSAAIEHVGDHLVHFHAVENNRGTPGHGQVRWEEVAAALRKIGYTGSISIESFTFKPDLSDLAAMWRPWFDDPDAFARDALSFVRATFG